MRLDNQTGFDGRFLRKLVTEAHRQLAESEGRLEQWKRTRIEIVYCRANHAGGSSGYAFLKGTLARIRIARRATFTRVFKVVWHELLHLYGYDHSHMRGGGYPSEDRISRAAERLGIDVASTIPVLVRISSPRPGIRERRLERLIARRATWESKRKRAENALAKITRQITYYERVIAAKGVGREGES